MPALVQQRHERGSMSKSFADWPGDCEVSPSSEGARLVGDDRLSLISLGSASGVLEDVAPA